MDSFSDTSLSLTLSREELAYMVRLNGASQIPGMDADVETILRPGSGDGFYAAVERALIARGMLSIEPDRRLAASPVLQELIRLCIRPAYAVVLALTDQFSNSTPTRRFYIVPNLSVLHRQPLPGIHQLTALTGKPFDLATMIAALLTSDGINSRHIVFRISSLMQSPPVTHEYTISCTDGEYWFSEYLVGEGGTAPAKRQVAREDLIVQIETIGKPIHAISTLQIEPQP